MWAPSGHILDPDMYLILRFLFLVEITGSWVVQSQIARSLKVSYSYTLLILPDAPLLVELPLQQTLLIKWLNNHEYYLCIFFFQAV